MDDAPLRTTTPAILLPPGAFPILSLPLGYTPQEGPPLSLAVLLHLYYEDLGPEMRDILAMSLPGPADLYVTTDTEAKREALRACFADWPHGQVEVRLVPNRGRDVAPRIVGLADVHERYELCLNLHGKRSLYWELGDDWRRDQVEVLARNRAVVSGILEAFRRWPRLGLVMPRIFEHVRTFVDWGFDLDRCAALAQRLGFEVSQAHALYFPAGSMFWTRRGAVDPLLALNLGFEDFEEEDGLPYGSLAHAIERLMLHICEIAGYHWLVVGRSDAGEAGGAELMRARSPLELDAIVASGVLRLTDPDLNALESAGTLRARYQPDRTAPTRLTLLLDHSDIEAGAEPGSPLARLIEVLGAGRSFGARRVVLPAQDAGSPLLRRLLPAGTHFVPLAADGLATPLALGAGDVLLTTEGPAGALAERLRASAEQLGETPFRLWCLRTPTSAPARR